MQVISIEKTGTYKYPHAFVWLIHEMWLVKPGHVHKSSGNAALHQENILGNQVGLARMSRGSHQTGKPDFPASFRHVPHAFVLPLKCARFH